MAAPLLLKALPFLRHRLIPQQIRRITGPLTLHSRRGTAESSRIDDDSPPLGKIPSLPTAKDQTHSSRWEDPEFRKWKDKEAEILKDIDPVICLTKEILHSGRYMDGERLTDEDEKVVVDKLLLHHPHSEDKIGCGLDSIMVDRHPQYKHSRCLFVVRTDGGWIDFSYQKCIRAYIRDKYSSHGERFIREHFKRSSR
ncbi:protein DCL, chloroplastic [Dorcoceras hygrometricum]|uniref:Protein DCL, chloroplastic n=1 Tax=Dorcoceras hygrometricum TaxID=472368 RepID=A0A2Z7DAT1_9LAMI|nr:protein DCL, chloroplastic [Dorcoceras hygrometricum]